MKLSIAFLLIGLLAIQFSQAEKSKKDNLQFSLNYLDSEILDVVWCGNNSQNDNNVLILTNKGTIYKSSDKMKTFEKISDKLKNLGISHLGEQNANVGGVAEMIRSQANSNQIVLIGTQSVNWITSDCGNEFKAISKDKQKQVIRNYKTPCDNLFQFQRMKSIKIHPTKENWFLALTENTCPKQKTTPCFSFQILWLSEDSGVTWKQLATYVSKFDWGYYNTTNSEVPLQRIYWTQETGNQQNQNRLGIITSRNFFKSDDFFTTKQSLVDSGNIFYTDKNYLYVVQLENDMTMQISLLVADPKQKILKFRNIQLGEKLNPNHYKILDTNEGQVFIHVNHLKSRYSPFGTLYISDATGLRFSQSLQGHVRSENGDTDFERLHGIYGIYIANVYDLEKREQLETFIQEDETDESEQNKKSSTSVDSNKKKSTYKDFKTENIQTMITFDKGGIWKRIPAPEQDENGKSLNCYKDCFLNIHSSSNDLFNSFYSSKNAIGLVLANGNVGQFLEHQPSQVNTYLSRDAGQTWQQIKKGAYVFEIGDHGSIIVMAKDKDYSTTKVIEYSFDEGLTWSQLQISNVELEIGNIITEPTNVSTSFMILAQTSNSSQIEKSGLAITVDFAPLLPEKCKNPQSPNSSDSDYEKWIPHGQQSDKCLLGQTITYSRRKRDRVCLNGEDFERVTDTQYCACTEEDWECDFGYSRQGDKPCTRDGTLSEDEYNGIIPQVCDDYYQVSKGYRKIPGNGCNGGVDHSPEWRRCPGNEIFSLNSLKYLFYLIVIIGAIHYGSQYKTQLSHILESLSSLIPVSFSHRKDYIDFSKAKTDHEEKHLKNMTVGNKLMSYFNRGQGNVNYYSNLQLDDAEETQQQSNQNEEQQNLKQHQYFTDDTFDVDDEMTQI